MHERIIGLYEDNARLWDLLRGRDLFEKPWMDRFLAGVKPSGSILDIGCGMGEPIARYLIARGFAVTGVDAAPSLIALCRERFPDHEWIVADMRALDLGRRFDGIIAWHSLFHLTPEDQRPMFARFMAHAAPGAALMFTSGSEPGDAIGAWEGEPLYHGSLAPEEYRTLLAEAGFALVANVISDPECGDSTNWIARKT